MSPDKEPRAQRNASALKIRILLAVFVAAAMGVAIVPVRGGTARSAAVGRYGRSTAAQRLGAAASSGTTITYTPKSSRKLEQVIGDCDWPVWDATNNLPIAPPICKRTTSQTITRGDVLGNGLGTSFEHNGELIVMFGDTIGATTGHCENTERSRTGGD